MTSHEQQRFEIDEAVAARAREILHAGPICDDCLGGAFGRLGRGMDNRDRAQRLRSHPSLSDVTPRPGSCWVCDGLFDTVDAWAERASRASAGCEFATYLFGLRRTPRLEAMEALLHERFPTGFAEPLKHGFNRRVGKAFEALVGGVTVAFAHPDLSFTVEPERDRLSMRVASLYLVGRYRKHLRGIPQTHWPCRACRGAGCDACNGTGKQYPESVEELVAVEPMAVTGARSAHLHGAGREDVDARMLGSGRPFVLELVSPKKRTIDPRALERAINAGAAGKVEVLELALTRKSTVAAIKETRAAKRYRVEVALSKGVDGERLGAAVAGLVGEIEQRTPRRVAHRRADLVRRKQVLGAELLSSGKQRAEITFHTEGGLYVKELVSGDDDRTHPSLTELLGIDARVVALDVLEVCLPGPPEDLETRGALA